MPKKIVESRGTHFERYRSRSCQPIRPQVLQCANDHCAMTKLHPEAQSIRCCDAQLLECSSQSQPPTLAPPEAQLPPADQVAKRAHPQVANCPPKPQCLIHRVMLHRPRLRELRIRQSRRCCLLRLTSQVRPASPRLMAVDGPRAATRCK